KLVGAATRPHALFAAADLRSLKGLAGGRLPAELLAAGRATLTADLPDDKTARVALELNFADAAGAREAVPAAERLLGGVAAWAAGRERTAAVGLTGEFARPLLEGIAAALKKAKVAADGPRLVVSAELDAADAVGRVLAAVPDAVLAGGGAERHLLPGVRRPEERQAGVPAVAGRGRRQGHPDHRHHRRDE